MIASQHLVIPAIEVLNNGVHALSIVFVFGRYTCRQRQRVAVGDIQVRLGL